MEKLFELLFGKKYEEGYPRGTASARYWEILYRRKFINNSPSDMMTCKEAINELVTIDYKT